ncbi:hypothetical protein C8A01DRAFT_16688 [Parachaetomium inaequale]|uniref:Uncharacterized protein n=1 Tax=Parachaetomium inaequale TaxID=2588326 RepID=A0AAN6SR79_9PEZI|nr:hypothetical protein C8A01DRAFT_16688 [Parachaetomium inaequale]
MLHWDLTEYLWSLENLAENLWPAWTWSSCCFGASALAKACQLYFWPSREHEAASGTVLTALTAYHAGFSLAYLSALYLASRCSRHAQVLQGKVREQLRQRASWGLHPKGAADGTVCEDDVRAWGGFNFALVGWVANQRHLRTIPLKSKHPPWIWVSGLIANWVSL